MDRDIYNSLHSASSFGSISQVPTQSLVDCEMNSSGEAVQITVNVFETQLVPLIISVCLEAGPRGQERYNNRPRPAETSQGIHPPVLFSSPLPGCPGRSIASKGLHVNKLVVLFARVSPIIVLCA